MAWPVHRGGGACQRGREAGGAEEADGGAIMNHGAGTMDHVPQGSPPPHVGARAADDPMAAGVLSGTPNARADFVASDAASGVPPHGLDQLLQAISDAIDAGEVLPQRVGHAYNALLTAERR